MINKIITLSIHQIDEYQIYMYDQLRKGVYMFLENFNNMVSLTETGSCNNKFLIWVRKILSNTI